MLRTRVLLPVTKALRKRSRRQAPATCRASAHNNAPVENLEVKLCETFSRFLSGCGGKTFTARTDKEGDFVIANVEPKEYEGLMVRVFETDSYIFATTGIAGLSAAKYNVVADKTLCKSHASLQGRFENSQSKGGLDCYRAGPGTQMGRLSRRRLLQIQPEPRQPSGGGAIPERTCRGTCSKSRSRWRRAVTGSKRKPTTARTRSCRRPPTILSLRSTRKRSAF